jgi:hypothetical protein
MSTTIDSATPRLSPRLAVTLVFAAFGVIGGTWAGSIPVLVRRLGLSEQDWGFLLMIIVLTNVGAFVGGGQLARFVSGRRIMLVALPVSAVSLACAFASPSLATFVPAVLAFTLSHGLIDICMNAEGSTVESEMQRPLLTGMHATVSFAVAICALIGSLVSVTYGPLATVPLLLAAGAAGAWVASRGVPDRLKRAASPAATASRSAFGLPLVVLGLAAGLATGGELVTFFWSAKLLDTEAPSLAAISGLGTSFLCGCAALARIFGDRVRASYGDRNVFLGSLAVTALGMIGVAATSGFVPHVLAFAVIGFGTAYMVPCLFAIAANTDPSARAARIGQVLLIGGPFRIASPYLFGWIAQHGSPALAFGAFSVAMVAAAGLFVVSQGMMAAAKASVVSRQS